jgi:hypothetical protein
MKTFFLFLLVFTSCFSFSQKIIFEVYRVDLYSKLGRSTFQTSICDYTETKKDIKLKEIFIFDLDSSLLKISSYPNTETEIRTFKIDNVIKNNDSITVKSKIKLNKKSVLYDFIANFNIDDDDSYINILFYDVVNNESTLMIVNHFNLRK